VRWGWEIRHLAPLAATAAGLAMLASCGGDQTFTASEFVDSVNDEGVTMRLGDQLQTSGGAEELHVVTLPPLSGAPERDPSGEGEHGHEEGGASGSLYVYGEVSGAEEQLDACRASAGLICFRASNVVVVLDEESGRLEAQRLGVAIRRLSDE
jgi:hypothetical protein